MLILVLMGMIVFCKVIVVSIYFVCIKGVGYFEMFFFNVVIMLGLLCVVLIVSEKWRFRILLV